MRSSPRLSLIVQTHQSILNTSAPFICTEVRTTQIIFCFIFRAHLGVICNDCKIIISERSDRNKSISCKPLLTCRRKSAREDRRVAEATYRSTPSRLRDIGAILYRGGTTSLAMTPAQQKGQRAAGARVREGRRHITSDSFKSFY